jgi:hypothetical protein
MKYTLYIALFFALISAACSNETSKPFTEVETIAQDSIDEANQNDAFNELLEDSTSNDTTTTP